MTRSTQHGGRQPTAGSVTPIARAIRIALAVSATALTLAAPLSSFAGDCSLDAGNNAYACDGVFTQTLPDGSLTAPDDLTLVLGGVAPTSVITAVGAMGIDADWGGNVSVVSDAGTDIETDGADGVHVHAAYGNAAFTNYGSVHTDVSADGIAAVDVDAVYDVTVINGGDVTATDGYGAYGAYDVTAVNLYSAGGSVSVDNQASGTLNASAYEGNARALIASTHAYYGSVDVANEGSLTARSTRGNAVGISASADTGYATVENSGNVQASAYGSATGIVAEGYYAAITNSGSIYASASANTGDAAASGAASVTSLGSGSPYLANAYLNNEAYASITANARSGSGNALAVGGYVYGWDVGRLGNYGSVTAQASSTSGNADAYAAVVSSGYAGVGTIINGGDLTATATSGGNAEAIGAMVYADVASIFNDDSITSSASATGGTALAEGARTYGNNVAINNYSSMAVNASGLVANATGAHEVGQLGATFYNDGDIEVSASGAIAASADGAYVGGRYTAYSTNLGTLAAKAIGGEATAIGLADASYLAAGITNQGTISAEAVGLLAPYGSFEAVATGAYSLATVYGATVDNEGTITATATATADISGTSGFLVAKAVGARAASQYGLAPAEISNTDSISGTATTSQGYAGAWGAVVQAGQYGTATIDNDASITSDASTSVGSADSLAAYVHSIAGTASVINHGDIVASSQAERGVLYSTLDASYATGAKVISLTYGGGAAAIDNYGNIEADAAAAGGIVVATGAQTYAMQSTLDNAAGASIAANARANLYGAASATAVNAQGKYGVAVINDGSISASGYAHGYAEGTHRFYGASRALGIYANATGYHGNTSVVNHGDITATANSVNSLTFFNGGAGATGITATTKYHGTVENTGTITATASSQLGGVGAYGASLNGGDYDRISNAAGAAITIASEVGSLYSDAYGGRAVAYATKIFGTQGAAIYNAGSISASATVTADGGPNPNRSLVTAVGGTIGSFEWSPIQTGTITNLGDIDVTASGDFGYATSYGARVITRQTADIENTGSIHVTANAASGNAFATGSFAYAVNRQVSYNCGDSGCDYNNPIVSIVGGDATLGNSGAITATTNAAGGVGDAYASAVVGAFSATASNSGQLDATAVADNALASAVTVNSTAGNALLQNDGALYATATGTTIANATGATVIGTVANADSGYPAALLSNHGDIFAIATGVTANATGAAVSGRGTDGVEVDNDGTISVGAYGSSATATAVSLQSGGTNVLSNSGSISAVGTGVRMAVTSNSAIATTITNAGSLAGAITTGDGADSLDNEQGGIWYAVDTSDFGAGDDRIVNHGTLSLHDASINLAGYVDGNVLQNYGSLVAMGSQNRIDMGNLSPVVNNGAISFVDGAPDDALTIAGNFAGQGSIAVDVSPRHQLSDQLVVSGSVAAPTHQTLNVNVVDLPTTAHVEIPVVLAGSVVDGEFELGNIAYAQDGFVALGFGLDTQPKQVLLDVNVTGLNDNGRLAAAVAPGMQDLLTAQVGTWRQRMGVVPARQGARVAPWVRMFTNGGSVDLANSANFAAGGSYGIHQSNQGWELGLDARPTDHLMVGALLGDSNGSQRLRGGNGKDDLDGTSYGLYGTWLAGHGFYLDLSQRWTRIDADLHDAGGSLTTRGHASTFNIETGFTAWSHQGLQIVPQLQYTHSRISGIGAMASSDAMFDANGGTSSRARLGVAIDKNFHTAKASWTPYASVNLVREFGGNWNYRIDDGLQGSVGTGGTSAMVEAGLGMHTGKLSLTGGVNWSSGGAVHENTGAQVVVRYDW
jgi:outer membrane autotransporter protein